VVVDGDAHVAASLRLRAIRQRYTAQRRALVARMADAAQPLTIPQLLACGAELPKSSVYRNLVVLEQAGVVERLVTADGAAHYELSEALRGHHHHLVCAGCGRVEDFTAPTALEEHIAAAAAQTAQQRGFRLERHRFDLVGTCARCAGRG
jgi:Fur family ferric uptake transcriptional regulator